MKSVRRRTLSICLEAALCLALLLCAQIARAEPGAEKYAPPVEIQDQSATATPPAITWRVENPFRLFKKPTDTDVHRVAWEQLSLDDRQNPILAVERALNAHTREGWAAKIYKQTCWNAGTNRYECAKSKAAFVNPDHHMVEVELNNVEDAVNVDCTWLIAPRRQKKRVRRNTIKQPCDKPARLMIPYPDGASVEVHIGERRIATTPIKVTDLLVVGVGDSFGSGEGNPDVPVRFSHERAIDYGNGKKETRANLAGYPARVGPWRKIGDAVFTDNGAQWTDRACHRSLYSHQLRAALQLAIEQPHRAITYVGLSCSGAEVTFGMFLRYKGNEWVDNPPQYSQISAAARAQCGDRRTDAIDLPEAYHIRGAITELKGGLVLHKCPRRHARRIDLLLVSIGGNDIGFARMLANAILTDKSMLRSLGGWMGQVHGRYEANSAMRSLDERFKALNRAFHNLLHVPWRQSDRIILTAYPSMALLEDGTSVCPDGIAGMEVAPEFSLKSSRARESHTVAEALNAKMKKSARRHGWTYVDSHRKQFIGRGVCAGRLDQGALSTNDLRLPRRVGGIWQPYDPARYRPYASRTRWFRTPNDAFMTANYHVSASILQKVLKLKSLRWFQLLLASTYSGAFHPSAEGQAAIADALLIKARHVLEKYGQGGTR